MYPGDWFEILDQKPQVLLQYHLANGLIHPPDEVVEKMYPTIKIPDQMIPQKKVHHPMMRVVESLRHN